MNTPPSIKRSPRPAPVAAGVAAVLTLWAMGQADAASWKGKLGVSLKESYSDNVSLAAKGSEQSDTVTEVAANVSMGKTGGRLGMRMDYRLQSIRYQNNSSSDSIKHQFQMNADLEVVEDLFDISASGYYTQQVIDTAGQVAVDTLSITDNRTDVYSLTVVPTLKKRFGVFATGQLSTSMTTVNQNGVSQSSQWNSVNGSLVSGPRFNRLGWNLDYSYQKEDNSNVTFRKLGLGLSYRIGPKTRLIANAGFEDNDYATSSGSDPKGGNWSLGVNWLLGRRTNIEFTFGHRYFDRTYSLDLSHTTRLRTWNLVYDEDHSTVSLVQSTQQAFDDQGNAIVVNDLPTASTEVYIRRRLTMTSTTQLSKKTRWVTSAYHERREYQTTKQHERIGGGSVTWNWNIDYRRSASIGANWRSQTFRGSDREDSFWTLSADYSHIINPNLNAVANYRHTQRDSTESGSEITDNVLSASLRYTF